MAVLLSDALLSLPNKVYVGNESVIVMQLVMEAFLLIIILFYFSV